MWSSTVSRLPLNSGRKKINWNSQKIKKKHWGLWVCSMLPRPSSVMLTWGSAKNKMAVTCTLLQERLSLRRPGSPVRSLTNQTDYNNRCLPKIKSTTMSTFSHASSKSSCWIRRCARWSATKNLSKRCSNSIRSSYKLFASTMHSAWMALLTQYTIHTVSNKCRWSGSLMILIFRSTSASTSTTR